MILSVKDAIPFIFSLPTQQIVGIFRWRASTRPSTSKWNRGVRATPHPLPSRPLRPNALCPMSELPACRIPSADNGACLSAFVPADRRPDCIFFDSHLLHRSEPNQTSDRGRAAFVT